ncbi:hypothetical protein HDV00_002713 [Rhizophlyctis rosea]|nr:hypothetical protein HDV00_002713 [Rhizophlyctis rosea]
MAAWDEEHPSQFNEQTHAKTAVNTRRCEDDDQFKELYGFAFKFAKETDQKCVPMDRLYMFRREKNYQGDPYCMFFFPRELAEERYSGAEVRVTRARTEVIIRATGSRREGTLCVRELTSPIYERGKLPREPR